MISRLGEFDAREFDLVFVGNSVRFNEGYRTSKGRSYRDSLEGVESENQERTPLSL
ncbi:MAG: hypothetical protein KAW84_06735 [Thermoplasmata archaeon]|nr:hypothetical protein [Thermoplasmata archaeon]